MNDKRKSAAAGDATRPKVVIERTYRAQVGVSEGRVVIHSGSISGMLGYVIPVEDLERAANEAIAASLNSSNIQVTDVTLVDGEMVLTMESTGAGNDIPTG